MFLHDNNINTINSKNQQISRGVKLKSYLPTFSTIYTKQIKNKNPHNRMSYL